MSDFAKPDELSGNGSGIYALADGVTEGQFETALTEAREEGNLSRANIVRKLKGTGKTRQFFTAAQRVEQIRDLSDSGKTSGQIGQELGIAETRVRELAREAAIVIAADATVRGSRRVDSNQIIAGTVEAAAIPSSALDLVVYSDLDRDHLREWISSLSESIKTLQALRSRLEKELNP